MKLFEGQEQPKLKLKINKQFAEKYQKKKERELLDKKGEILDQEESSEDQIPEDENGDLINDKVTQKFIETLAKIRYCLKYDGYKLLQHSLFYFILQLEYN